MQLSRNINQAFKFYSLWIYALVFIFLGSTRAYAGYYCEINGEWLWANSPCTHPAQLCVETYTQSGQCAAINYGIPHSTAYDMGVPIWRYSYGAANCTAPWGATVNNGSSVTAYLSTTGNPTCTSQTRTCTSGTLSGTYTNASCTAGCSFNGSTVASGSSVTAYLSATGNPTCTSQTRTCTSGTLSGTYTYASCAAGCTFNGSTVASGSSVTAYQSATGNPTCTSQTRTCTNGTLSGTYTNASCSAGCTFNGSTVASGTNALGTWYAAATQSFASNGGSYTCTNTVTPTCTNGTMSHTLNSTAFSSCTVTGLPCAWVGETMIADGASVTAYQTDGVAFGGTCASQTRTCSNGTLSGTYAYSECNVDCDGLAHSASVTRYQTATVPAGSSCVSESRTCNNGTLSGSFTNTSCQVGCELNGVAVEPNDTITAYQASTGNLDCVSEERLCSNGELSGSYTFSSCTPSNQSCSFNGQTIAHGGSVSAYQVPNGTPSCGAVSESRSCNNGVLSGSYTYASCAPQDCTIFGQTLANYSGSGPIPEIYAYQAETVPYGTACPPPPEYGVPAHSCTDGCIKASIFCLDGQLWDESIMNWYPGGWYASCTVEGAPPSDCTFNGQTVAHGAAATGSWYAAATEDYNTTGNSATCVDTVTPTCTNGTMSNGSAVDSCTVSNVPAGGASCTLAGTTVADGASVTAYQTPHVPMGGTCQSQSRTCTNGTLSGSYNYTSCSPIAECD